MTTNINFSFTRLMAVMKRDMMENWKINMYRLIGCYSILVIPFIIGMRSAERSIKYGIPGDLYVQFCDRVHSFITFFLFFYILAGASMIMEVMNTKNKRISYMMLPATTGEKFISRAVFVSIISLVALFLVLFLAELTRLLFVPLFNLPEEFHRFSLFNIISVSFDNAMRINQLYTGESSTKIISYLFIISNALWSHSVYILGGTYFRKNPFPKTMGICIVVFFILAYILINLSRERIILSINNGTFWSNTEELFSTISIIFFIFTVINWTLSYHMFRNSQITDRKLFKR